MIFAETPRLYLRQLEESDLPRLAELIGDWDVVKWLSMVPHPYALKDAEEFYAKMLPAYQRSEPEFLVVALRADNFLIGAIGLHSTRVPNPQPGEIEIGYWLGKSCWQQDFMSEAVRAAIEIAFQRPKVSVVAATTDPVNEPSKNVLRKAGLKNTGIFPRVVQGLRGPPELIRWELSRADYEKRTAS